MSVAPAPPVPVPPMVVARPVRVASVPATHRYVRSLHHPLVEVVTDPSGDDHHTPCYLDPDWVRVHAREFDVWHVHFGFEFYPPAQLEAVCRALALANVPLVHTAHDLRNPNHVEADLHDAGLAVWMRHADAVVTLTPWAARRITRRFGRTAQVLPHPVMAPVEVMRRPRRRSTRTYRIGLLLKSLRPNMRAHDALDGLLAGLDACGPGARGRVDLHPDVLDPDSPTHDPRLAARLWEAVSHRDTSLELHVHHYFEDAELWDMLCQLDAFLLPYGFGTHSGLLEACRDLGIAVVGPDVGGYADQGVDHLFPADESGLDVDGVARAVRAAVAAGRREPLGVADRLGQRARIADAHHALYRDLLAARRGLSA